MACEKPLRGARILIAEDNALIALDLQSLLEDAGAEVVGLAGTVAQALALAGSATPTCAVLDVILHGELVFPVARMLRERGVPMIFYTGSSYMQGLGRDWPDAPIIMKPAALALLIQTIGSACAL